MREIITAKDPGELNEIAAKKFVSIGQRAITETSKFTVALAGGSTPKSLYNLLASENYRSRIDWQKVFFFFGDERNVLPDSDESNFRMANENLLLPLQIPDENIFRWHTELQNTENIAEEYEKTIKGFFNLSENEIPRFDLILLGMGDDGHTASLFPFTEALYETEKITFANYVKKLRTTRLTLTFPAINNAANVVFLISGGNKAETLREVLEGDFQPEKYPSQSVNPANGNVYWLVDANAAKMSSEI